jgi:hypothetical protein
VTSIRLRRLESLFWLAILGLTSQSLRVSLHLDLAAASACRRDIADPPRPTGHHVGLSMVLLGNGRRPPQLAGVALVIGGIPSRPSRSLGSATRSGRVATSPRRPSTSIEPMAATDRVRRAVISGTGQ